MNNLEKQILDSVSLDDFGEWVMKEKELCNLEI